MAIKRIWHGWTTYEDASAYQALLYSEVIPTIEDRKIDGYWGITVLRRDLPEEVEFVTIMKFNRIEDVITFQGGDYELSFVPAAARLLLKRWDERSAHYEVVDSSGVHRSGAL